MYLVYVVGVRFREGALLCCISSTIDLCVVVTGPQLFFKGRFRYVLQCNVPPRASGGVLFVMDYCTEFFLGYADCYTA